MESKANSEGGKFGFSIFYLEGIEAAYIGSEDLQAPAWEKSASHIVGQELGGGGWGGCAAGRLGPGSTGVGGWSTFLTSG